MMGDRLILNWHHIDRSNAYNVHCSTRTTLAFDVCIPFAGHYDLDTRCTFAVHDIVLRHAGLNPGKNSSALMKYHKAE